MLNKNDNQNHILLMGSIGDFTLRSKDSSQLKSHLLHPLAEHLKCKGITTSVCLYPSPSNKRSISKKITSVQVAPFVLFALGRILDKIFFRKERRATCSLWRLLLIVNRAKAIVAIQPTHELCKSAHELNIVIGDLQHGMIEQNDSYYRFLSDRTINHKLLPDLLIFSFKMSYQYWHSNSISDVKLMYLGDGISNNTTRGLKSKSISPKLKKNILFTQQYGFEDKWGTSLGDVEGEWITPGLPAGLLEFISIHSDEFTLCIRLHPLETCKKAIESTDNYLATFNGQKGKFSILLTDPSSTPLEEQLINIDYHITSHSAVIYTTIEWGIPTAVLTKNKSIKKMLPEESISSSLTQLSNNYVSIANWITSSKNQKTPPILRTARCNEYDKNVSTLISYLGIKSQRI